LVSTQSGYTAEEEDVKGEQCIVKENKHWSHVGRQLDGWTEHAVEDKNM
jgi:hypothetical protein